MTTVPDNVISQFADELGMHSADARMVADKLIGILRDKNIVLVSPETLALAMQKELIFMRGSQEEWLKASCGIIQKVIVQ